MRGGGVLHAGEGVDVRSRDGSRGRGRKGADRLDGRPQRIRYEGRGDSEEADCSVGKVTAGHAWLWRARVELDPHQGHHDESPCGAVANAHRRRCGSRPWWGGRPCGRSPTEPGSGEGRPGRPRWQRGLPPAAGRDVAGGHRSRPPGPAPNRRGHLHGRARPMWPPRQGAHSPAGAQGLWLGPGGGHSSTRRGTRATPARGGHLRLPRARNPLL